MEINFCKDCDNMMFLYTDEDEELYYGCKACGNIEDVGQTHSSTCVYNNSQLQVDKSEVINSNPYITHDITLPSIQNNPNIKCQNEACNPETTDIKFIKYDEINMKYIYICNHCSSKWRNSL